MITQTNTCSGSGVISKKELKLFYTAFLDAGKLEDTAVAELTEKSYKAMTSNGEVQLSFHMYKLSFLNFLLGKQPNGPGQWLFGQVEREESGQEQFLIDFTFWSREEEMVRVVGLEQEDKKTEKEDGIAVENTLPAKLTCTDDTKEADFEKTVANSAAESNDKEEGFKSRGGNTQEGDLERDSNQSNNVNNMGTNEITPNNNANNKRAAKDSEKKKTDQRSKKEKEKRKEKGGRKVEKEFAEKRKESAIEGEEDKVRIKRVEVTSKKSILV